MTKLRVLDLRESAITGRGLGYLPAPERLVGLDLGHVDLTDAVNSPLLKMVNLRAIRLAYSPIEDDTVAVLAKLRNLEMLNLDETFVTDNGLSRLRDLPRLKYLSVTATRVSSEGAAEFRKARPDVRLQANDLEN